MTRSADLDQSSRSEAACLTTSDRQNFAFQIFAMTKLLTRTFDERARAMSLPGGDAMTTAQWQMLGTIRANVEAASGKRRGLAELAKGLCRRSRMNESSPLTLHFCDRASPTNIISISTEQIAIGIEKGCQIAQNSARSLSP